MAETSKQGLSVINGVNFPDNTTGYITPAKLREFNQDVIDSTVNQIQYDASQTNLNAFTSSITASVQQLLNLSSSLSGGYATQGELDYSASVLQANIDTKLNTSSFNSYTASTNIRLNNLESTSASLLIETSNLELFTSSANIKLTNLEAFTTSADIRLDNLEITSQSVNISIQNINSFTQSVSPTGTGSLLVTASFANGTITFTKGNNDTFTLQSFVSSGSNQFNGDQTVNGFVSASNGFYSGPNTTALNIGDGSNIRFWSGSTGGANYYNVQLIPDSGGDIAFSRSGAGNVKVLTLAGTAEGITTLQNNPIQIQGSVTSLSIQAQSTAISGSGSYSLNASTISNTAATATTNASSSFIGTVSITGQSGNDGRAILLGHSGSLVIGNSQSNAYYAELSYISSSQANSNTNLIFKTNTNTTGLTVSGSANLFVPPSAPTSEFKRYLGGSGNIALLAAVMPQITGSNQISPTFNNNIFQGNSLFMRTPVSSSAWTISGNSFNNFGNLTFGTAQATSFVSASAGVTVSNNFVGGTLSATAYKTQLYSPFAIIQSYFGGTLTINNDSSSVQFVNSAMQGALTVHNSYNAGTTTQLNSLSVNAGNVFMGTNNVIYASGSNTTTSQQRQFQSSALIGSAHSASVVLNGDNAQLTSTALIGHALIVTGSSGLTTTNVTAADRGTVIVGRFNSEVLSGNTVFAVGAGTSTSVRRNALTIDSGSNSTFSGSVIVSGSVAGNVTALSIASSTASMDMSLGNLFTLTLTSGATHLDATNIRLGQTVNLLVTQDASGTGTLTLAPKFKQPIGFTYTATPAASALDILTFATFGTTGSIFTLNAKQFT